MENLAWKGSSFSKQAGDGACRQASKCQLTRRILVTSFISSCVRIAKKVQNQRNFRMLSYPKVLRFQRKSSERKLNEFQDKNHLIN